METQKENRAAQGHSRNRDTVVCGARSPEFTNRTDGSAAQQPNSFTFSWTDTSAQRPDVKIFSGIPRHQTLRPRFLPQIHRHEHLAWEGRPSNMDSLQESKSDKHTDVQTAQTAHIQAETDLQSGRDSITCLWKPQHSFMTPAHSAPVPGPLPPAPGEPARKGLHPCPSAKPPSSSSFIKHSAPPQAASGLGAGDAAMTETVPGSAPPPHPWTRRGPSADSEDPEQAELEWGIPEDYKIAEEAPDPPWGSGRASWRRGLLS